MASVSEGVWWCTDLPDRDDGKKILEELTEIERSTGQLPDWAVSIALNCIGCFPPCGHEMFEHNVNAVLEAIGERREVQGFFYCFMVSDQALAKAQQVVEKCSNPNVSTPASEVLASRLRWWRSVNAEVKSNPFADDGARNDYYEWDEKTRGVAHDSRLSLDGELAEKMKNTWLCAPKAFRFIEKIGVEIGVELREFDMYSKKAFQRAIADAMTCIETAILRAEAGGDSVARFLLILLRAKLTEYTRNGFLRKVVET